MARDRLVETKKLLGSGRDPAVQAKLAKITRAVEAANTFNLVADEYLNKYQREGRAEATVSKARWLVDFARSDVGLRLGKDGLPVGKTAFDPKRSFAAARYLTAATCPPR